VPVEGVAGSVGHVDDRGEPRESAEGKLIVLGEHRAATAPHHQNHGEERVGHTYFDEAFG